MNGRRKRKLYVYACHVVLSLLVIMSAGCLTTKTKRDIPRAILFDNEYGEYIKLDAKMPPADKAEEHMQKLSDNAKYRTDAYDLENAVVNLEKQTIPDLQAEVAYLEGRVASQNQLKNAYMDSITDSMHRIWTFNNDSLNTIRAKNDTSYIPLGLPAFKREDVWNPTVEKSGVYSLIVDVSHPAQTRYFPVEGEIFTSFLGKYRFVIVRPQRDGTVMVLPLGDVFYEITESERQDGNYYKKVRFQKNLEVMEKGDYAGIIVENRLGVYYDASTTIDKVGTGNVLLLPWENIEKLPKDGAAVNERQHKKEMSFSFSLLGRYDRKNMEEEK